MEFDENGNLKAQKITKTIRHEPDHDRLYPPIRKKQTKEIKEGK